MARSIAWRQPIGARQYAATLAAKYGCGRRFEPVECWHVSNGDEITKVWIVMVRGHCDNRHSAFDYAETESGDVVLGSRYLFPAKTHKRPALVEMEDDFGKYRDWVADPKKRP
jgi:hypothetical protein